jgi:Tfp pilus assembly protein PilF
MTSKRLFRFQLPGALVLAIWPLAAPAAEPAGDVTLIEQAIDGGRFVQAEIMLDKWARQSGGANMPDAERIGAELALGQRRDEEAATRLAALAQQPASNCRVDEGLGIAYLRTDRHADALPLLLRAVTKCPDRWQSWNALAVAQDFQGAWSDSGKSYDRAYALTDRRAAVLNNYGFSLLRQRRVTEATRLFALAHAANRDNPRYLNNLDIADTIAGRSLKPEGRVTEANDTAWTARLNNAGYVSLLSGNTQAAESYFKRAMAEGGQISRRAEANLALMEKSK